MPMVEADFMRGRAARHRVLLVHLFLLLFLAYTSAQVSEVYYSQNFSRPFDNVTLDIFSPATGLAPNGSALCLTQPIDNRDPNDSSSQSEAAGRGLYKHPFQVRDPATKIVKSFSTMFSFWIDSNTLYDSGHGFAFVWAPDNTSTGFPGMYLGWLDNSTNGERLGNFAVEFDTVQNEEFDDPERYHVGVNVNSLQSLANCTSQFGYYEAGAFKRLPMWTDAEIRVYAWINYDSSRNELSVTVSPSNAKPERALLTCALNMSDHIQSDDMYVGFTASTGSDSHGEHLSQHTVYEWSFAVGDISAKNLFGNDTISNELVQPSELPILLIAITVPCAVFVLAVLVTVIVLHRRHKYYKKSRRFHDSDLDTLDTVRGPEKFSLKQLSTATNSFSKDACIGEGGFGKVYKGALPKRSEVLAVKRLRQTSRQGAQEFAAEVRVIGCVQHRNLVPLLGWCNDVGRDGRGELLLVYEFMPNGNLDHLLFTRETEVLSWERRVNILFGVGSALEFLHVGWKQRVVHRDVKASNVMLDADFNARLGDFGLARLYDHSQDPKSTLHPAGTPGYMAPELFDNGKPTEKTDVYSFGALALEVATGFKASGTLPDTYGGGVNGVKLVDWVWGLYRQNQILAAADARLEGKFDPDEMTAILHLGLLCSHPDPASRPTMRHSLAMLKRESEVPLESLPLLKPLPPFAFSMSRSESILFTQSTTQKTDFDDLSVNSQSTKLSTRSTETYHTPQEYITNP